MSLNYAWIALSQVPRIGNKTLHTLHEAFGEYEAILSASKSDLKRVRGVGEKTALAIQAINLDVLQENIERWQAQGVQIITQEDEHYPQILRDIPDAPLTLFVRGNYQPERWQSSVAIIGTRQPTAISRSTVSQLAEAYADKGWTVVSGLALGIDAAAHQGVLQNHQGRTIAILGGGVLNVYPTENIALANRILESGGALLSENAPDATSTAPRLVTRNRIISGFSKRVIVVQSDVNGGAMHAAKAAFAQGRDVYTFDEPFTGNQHLLSDGAKSINLSQHVIPYAH